MLTKDFGLLKTVLFSALIALLSWAKESNGQDDFLVTLRDGTVLRTQLQLGSIPWRRIDQTGSVSADQLQIEGVQKLELAHTPASRQLIDIRQHLANLQSENYHVRNQAEAALVQGGSQFIEVLSAARENGNAEVRYRVGRVLKRLQSKDAKRIDADFDIVTLASGELISGDLEFESLDVSFQGQSLQLHRDTILRITRATAAEATQPTQWMTQFFGKPEERFYQAGDVHINFDVGRLNETFAKFEDIHDSYVFRGARLKADCGEDPATIVTAGFAIDQARSRKNSAATMMVRNNKKYLGSVQVNFCEPALPNIPASVHRVGCYIALVDHPRDFVMDAYSADHQIVASAEALEKSAFMGVESAMPIAYVRVQPNRNLKLDPAEQDANFVIDDLTFDPPQFDPSLAVEGQALVQTKDGSRLVCSSLEFDGKSFIARSKSPLTLDGSNSPLYFVPNELSTITFWLSQPAARNATLWGYCTDGSILSLRVDGNAIASSDFDQWVIERSDLAGVNGGNSVWRFPLDEDLVSKQSVVVRPAERWLVPQVEIDADGVSWDGSTAQLREVFHLENSNHAADTTAKFSLADAPSIWWQAPPNPDPDLGWLQTVDGSRFVLNGSSQISLEKLEAEAVVLSRAGQTIRIPWSEVVALKFPNL